MSHRHPLVIGCVLGGLVFAAASFAGSSAAPGAADEIPQLAVRVDDLDLTRRDQVARLYHRFVVAADRVCPSVVRDLNRRAQAVACRRQALDQAVDRANLPQLTAFHRSRAAAPTRQVASL